MLRLATVHNADVQVLTHVHNTVEVFQGEYWTSGLFVTYVVSLTFTCMSHSVVLSDLTTIVFVWVSISKHLLCTSPASGNYLHRQMMW